MYTVKERSRTFIERFFEEKHIPSDIFVIKHKGLTHVIENGIVIDMIKQAPIEEQKVIEKQIRKIDFYNRDINHYLGFLANAYVQYHY
ncbi:TPA: hypothetical protein ACTZ1F_002778 [Bacillus cereus]|uniref:Uncharacterized protein n=1 Tax=Bacillus cereus TaxID=1396 RepID=A0A9X0GDR2_BACCE|nr:MULTISPECIES: hypothetical protein [Bacillus cereus group]KMP22719.1 hypothetical protein TQ94_00110 [Bacillus cereus]MCC3873750.1 hypothetical protein [Bacillus thuringiensis]MCC3880182.1 hypothetical protein [Bacillus thuringiensis]MCC3886368.1 hypothetical protein [Bacillus thuringiensis]MCC3892098.1 hypothetical protein [Bacillus thuringiensis]